MKQRIVIKVAMHGDKCRSKAMKIAVVAQGVNSVSIEGEGGDQVVVVGDGVDSVCLTNMLRKKFPFATLVTVEDVQPANDDAAPNPEDVQPANDDAAPNPEDVQPANNDAAEIKAYTCMLNQNPNLSLGYYSHSPPSCPSYYHVVYDPYPNSCSIL